MFTYIDNTTGQAQWEVPTAPAGGIASPAFNSDSALDPNSAPPAASQAKRRQYASGQTQAYYGTPEPSAQYGDAGAPPGGQLFTPGLANDGQPAYFAPEMTQQPQAPGYPNAPPAYGATGYVGQQQPGVGNMADQFAHMGLKGQKQVRSTIFATIGQLSDSNIRASFPLLPRT